MPLLADWHVPICAAQNKLMRESLSPPLILCPKDAALGHNPFKLHAICSPEEPGTEQHRGGSSGKRSGAGRNKLKAAASRNPGMTVASSECAILLLIVARLSYSVRIGGHSVPGVAG
jgi:hypothetical protein